MMYLFTEIVMLQSLSSSENVSAIHVRYVFQKYSNVQLIADENSSTYLLTILELMCQLSVIDLSFKGMIII